jgi:hypothetical protein
MSEYLFKRKRRMLLLGALVAALLLVFCLVTGVSAGPTDSVVSSITLIAGGGNSASAIPIGTVTVWEEENVLYIQYNLDTANYPDWVLTDVHSDAASSLEGIPQSKGNPVPGKFACSQTLSSGLTEATCTIPFDEITSDLQTSTVFTVAAHATVQQISGSKVIASESAWGEGDLFSGKNWATYFTYDPDLDDDGLWNSEEIALGTDPFDPDTDDDGLLDGEEVKTYHTDPLKADTDEDGLLDGEEVHTYGTDPLKADTDADGLIDGEEVLTYHTNPLKADTDDDGLTDYDELKTYFTDPLDADTDDDDLTDGEEVTEYGTNPLVADGDDDALTDGEEIKEYGTDPFKPDTDGDGLTDGAEVKTHGTNPLEADTDEDGLNDKQEIDRGSDPTDADSDDDGILDGSDNCPLNSNTNQADSDADTVGDVCDNCPSWANHDQKDSDSDGDGDACDCNDGVKGPYEYGVDCGGSCPYCTHVYEYLGNYPYDHPGDGAWHGEAGYTEDLNGVAHDDDNWYFTQTTSIWKIPLEADLEDDFNGAGPERGVLKVHMPEELSSCDIRPKAGSDGEETTMGYYNHFGDLYYDKVSDMLFIPVEGKGCDGHPSPAPMIAVFKASDLSLYTYAYLYTQTKAGWCAINPLDGKLYTSNTDIKADDPMKQYTIYREALGKQSDDFLGSVTPVKLYSEDGGPITLSNWMQGGEFSNDGMLYLIHGGDGSDGGIKVFDTSTWRLVAKSTNEEGDGGFKFEFHPGWDDYQEPEGVTYWDLTGDPRVPEDNTKMANSQLHVIMLDTDYWEGSNWEDDLFFKHYKIL